MVSPHLEDALKILRASGRQLAYHHGSQAVRTDPRILRARPTARVRWEPQARRIHSDEQLRVDPSLTEMLEAVRRGR